MLKKPLKEIIKFITLAGLFAIIFLSCARISTRMESSQQQGHIICWKQDGTVLYSADVTRVGSDGMEWARASNGRGEFL